MGGPSGSSCQDGCGSSSKKSKKQIWSINLGLSVNKTLMYIWFKKLFPMKKNSELEIRVDSTHLRNML